MGGTVVKTSLGAASRDKIVGRLRPAMAGFAKRFPAESGRRQPVHTVYGGAHLFRSDTAVKLGQLAVRAFDTFAPDAQTFASALGLPEDLAETIHQRVAQKLVSEAVEDLRIDFEDGYGTRSDDEEDHHSLAAAQQVAKGMGEGTLAPFMGIRIKPLSEEMHSRAIRTLDLYLTELVGITKGTLPDNFVVTLPKIVDPEQVRALVSIFDEIESKLRLARGSLKMEMMIETPQSIIADDGRIGLPQLLEAANGRCTAAHFGAYDYTASCSITAANQDMLHPACDFARNMMQVAFAGTGVWLSDGATNIMPIAPHRAADLTDAQTSENMDIVHRAWKVHYDHCRHSLANGFYQGWDLHPAQLPTRYAAVFAFFLEGLEAAAERLRNFVEKAAQASLVGNVFDDAATGQGLLNYFVRAINCRAVTEQEALDLTGLTLDQLRTGSFVKIINDQRDV